MMYNGPWSTWTQNCTIFYETEAQMSSSLECLWCGSVWSLALVSCLLHAEVEMYSVTRSRGFWRYETLKENRNLPMLSSSQGCGLKIQNLGNRSLFGFCRKPSTNSSTKKAKITVTEPTKHKEEEIQGIYILRSTT